MEQINAHDFFSVLSPANDLVELSRIPKGLHRDIENFMFGRTFLMRNGSPAFYALDYNEWLEKVRKLGLDYDIQLIE